MAGSGTPQRSFFYSSAARNALPLSVLPLSRPSSASLSFALVLTYFYPSLEIALVFLALSIALSRIVLGMHFLSDVLAGIVLGVALGCCALTTYASLGFL